MSDIVRTTRRGKVLEIVFDRPPVNAINRAAGRALSGAFAGPRLDRQARQLVATLREARSVAILQGREVRFRVDRGAWRYHDRPGAVRQGLTLALRAPPRGSGGAGRPAIRLSRK